MKCKNPICKNDVRGVFIVVVHVSSVFIELEKSVSS